MLLFLWSFPLKCRPKQTYTNQQGGQSGYADKTSSRFLKSIRHAAESWASTFSVGTVKSQGTLFDSGALILNKGRLRRPDSKAPDP